MHNSVPLHNVINSSKNNKHGSQKQILFQKKDTIFFLWKIAFHEAREKKKKYIYIFQDPKNSRKTNKKKKTFQ